MTSSDEKTIVTKSMLVSRLSERLGLGSSDDVKLAVDTMLDHVSGTIASGRRVEIRGFGSFGLTVYRPRTARNPRSGDPVVVGETRVPHFKAGSILSEKVDY